MMENGHPFSYMTSQEHAINPRNCVTAHAQTIRKYIIYHYPSYGRRDKKNKKIDDIADVLLDRVKPCKPKFEFRKDESTGIPNVF